MDVNNTSEAISYHQILAKGIDHTCDDNGNNLPNTEEEADVTSIHYINATNEISINDDDNSIHKYYALLLSSGIMRMYRLYQNIIQQNKELIVIKNHY